LETIRIAAVILAPCRLAQVDSADLFDAVAASAMRFALNTVVKGAMRFGAGIMASAPLGIR
jgi:hypothetical protein